MNLTFVVGGHPHEVRLSKAMHLSVLIAGVLARTGNSGQPPEQWELRDRAGNLLERYATVGRLGLVDGQVLFLNPRAGVGGATGRRRLFTAAAALALVGLLAPAAARAAEPNPLATPPPCGTEDKPTWCATAYTGTASVLTRGERREYLSARVSIAGPLLKGVSVFARGEATGQQDGAALDSGDPKTFRVFQAIGGARYPLSILGLPLRVSAIGAVTFSIEGDAGKPLDARLFTGGAALGAGLGDGGYVDVGAGWHGPVGAAALLASASVPIKGGAYSCVDIAFPLRRDVFQRKAWVLTIGGQVRVKTLRL